MFDEFFGQVRVREIPVSVEPIKITVRELPVAGRPPEFAGAVGQWQLEVSAQPTEVAVGDPITLRVRVSGTGDIGTVPEPVLGDLAGFKTYDPTSQTTRSELGIDGERIFEQVLVPKSTDTTAIPGIRLSYFDPVSGAYEVAEQPPIELTVKPGGGTAAMLIATDGPARRAEKLGEDIVYLKGDLGTAVAGASFVGTGMYWGLHLLPLGLLVGGVAWKRRRDRVEGDVAYARRGRAARRAMRLLDAAADHGDVQHALQEYLGDRLNLASAGLTAAIIDDRLVPRGLDDDSARRLRAVFEQCDSARFAGAPTSAPAVNDLVTETRRLFDVLERT